MYLFLPDFLLLIMTCNTTFNSCSLVNLVTFLSILFSYISNIAKISIDKLRIFGNFLKFYGFQIEMSFPVYKV